MIDVDKMHTIDTRSVEDLFGMWSGTIASILLPFCRLLLMFCSVQQNLRCHGGRQAVRKSQLASLEPRDICVFPHAARAEKHSSARPVKQRVVVGRVGRRRRVVIAAFARRKARVEKERVLGAPQSRPPTKPHYAHRPREDGHLHQGEEEPRAAISIIYAFAVYAESAVFRRPPDPYRHETYYTCPSTCTYTRTRTCTCIGLRKPCRHSHSYYRRA